MARVQNTWGWGGACMGFSVKGKMANNLTFSGQIRIICGLTSEGQQKIQWLRPGIQTNYHLKIKKSCLKNTERHTAHTIVSWPNLKQWVIIPILSTPHKIISIVTREMGKLKTHSPTYCIMDNWKNMLYLTHTLDKIYLAGIFISSMSSDKFAQWWYWDVQINEYDLQTKNDYLHPS